MRSATDGGPLSPLPIPAIVRQALETNTLESTMNVTSHRPVFAIVQNPLRVLGHAEGIVGLALALTFLLWLERSRQGRSLTEEQRFFSFTAITLLANQALWATGLIALFPLVILLVNSSRTPNRTALLLVLPLLLPQQVMGQQNYLIWLFCAAFCMYENGWLGVHRASAPMPTTTMGNVG